MKRMLMFLILCLLIGSLTVVVQAQSYAGMDTKLYEGLKYRMVGPHRGGRVTAVAGVPGNPPVLYFGGTGGGVWKSTNNGVSYENISDGFFQVGSIGAIAIAPSNPMIIYVGTGSACIRSNVSTGRGIYKSTDAGKTWQFAGLPRAGQIGKMVVHPQNPDLVFAAVLGQAFGKNPERGVYRSRDGGTTWEQVLYLSDSTGAVDLSINPQQPEILFASMWRAERKPWTIISGGGESGIYRTKDGGATWEKCSRGLPQGLIGKTAVSVSPADPQRIYALVEAPGDSGGLYRSDDGGDSFALINSQKSLMYRPFYYTHVTADPNDANTVYVNNEGFFKSPDGGKTFRRVRTPHGDNHDLWINPENSDYLFQANDGGVNVSLDGGRTWTGQYNQPTAELYHVVVDNQHPYYLYGEQQDNSTIMVPSLPPVAGGYLSPIQFWRAVAGCETGPIAVHPEKPHIVYGGCKGRFSRYNHLTGQEMQFWVYPHFNYGHAASDMPYRFQRTAPIEISPHDPSVIYHASQYLHKTTDEGRTWEVISPDLTAQPPATQGYSGEPITHDITGEEVYSAIYQVRESLHEPGVIWVGTNDGLLHITRDGGANWENITPADLPPGGRVQTIDPSPHDPGSAYVAIYRYMLGDWHPYIYKLENYGKRARRLTTGSNGIPDDQPTRVVRADPDRQRLLYAGTEFGMFVSFDDGAHWQSLQRNLPHTPVTDIRVHRKDLVLSTMGRSFWILDDISPLHQLNAEIAAANLHLFKPRDVYRYRWARGGRGNSAMPEYPPYGAFIYYYLAETPANRLTLEILDESGTVIRAYSSISDVGEEGGEENLMRPQERQQAAKLSTQPGMHRFVWDFRYPDAQRRLRDQPGASGPLVVPGRYQVRLSAGDSQQTQTFEVMLDPRLAEDGVTLADLQAQLELNLKIRDRIGEIHELVAEAQKVAAELDSLLQRAKGNNGVEDALKAHINALREIGNALVQTQAGKVGAQFKPKLLRQLTYLYSMTTAADQRPGLDAYRRFEDIEKELADHRNRLQRLLGEKLAQLRQQLKQAGIR